MCVLDQNIGIPRMELNCGKLPQSLESKAMKALIPHKRNNNADISWTLDGY